MGQHWDEHGRAAGEPKPRQAQSEVRLSSSHQLRDGSWSQILMLVMFFRVKIQTQRFCLISTFQDDFLAVFFTIYSRFRCD